MISEACVVSETKSTRLTEFPSGRLSSTRQDTSILSGERSALLFAFSAFGMSFLVFFGVYCLRHGSLILGTFDLVLAGMIPILLLGSFLLLKSQVAAAWCILGLMFVLFCYMFSTGGMDGTGYFWSLTFAPFATFVLGSKAGGIISGLLLATLILLTFAQAHIPGSIDYSTQFLVRYFAVFALLFGLTWFFEFCRSKAHTVLELRNRELTVALDIIEEAHAAQHDLSERLARSNAELVQFAYVASHDLKEPLRKIQAFGDRLTSKFHDVLGDAGNDYIDRMHKASSRMEALIDGLLSYSRVTTKAEPFVPVDLGAVLVQVLDDLETRVKETGAVLEVGKLPSIEADPLQMHQLLQNLVANALKYTKPRVAPVIRVSAVVDNGQCSISVKDNGIGFEQQYAQRIFGVFQRLHGRGSAYDGTGIGLSVCQRIVERHAGSISACGNPGEGAEFTFVLPLVQNAEPEQRTFP